MKTLLRNTTINFLTLFLIAEATGSIQYAERLTTLALAALALTVLRLVVRPVLNLLLMPINLITLGAFRWVVNVIVLLLVTWLIANFKIIGFDFAGLSFSGVVIPQVHFSFFWALVLVSFLVEILVDLFNWALK